MTLNINSADAKKQPQNAQCSRALIIIQNQILDEVQRIQSQTLDEWEQLNLTKLFPSFWPIYYTNPLSHPKSLLIIQLTCSSLQPFLSSKQPFQVLL